MHYVSEVRKHAGLMVAGPVQAAAAVAYADDRHVEAQRDVYFGRLTRFAAALAAVDLPVPRPGGGFYLWVPVPGGDDWHAADWLARNAGVLVSPGDIYGEAGRGYVRVALVAPDARLELAALRLAAAGPYRPAD